MHWLLHRCAILASSSSQTYEDRHAYFRSLKQGHCNWNKEYTLSWKEVWVNQSSIYPNIYLSIYLFLSLHLAIYLPFGLSIYLSIHLSMYLSIYLSIYLSNYLSIYIYIYVCVSIYLSICPISIRPSICLFYLSVWLSLCLSFRSSLIRLFMFVSFSLCSWVFYF
jgi:hypothetical protein